MKWSSFKIKNLWMYVGPVVLVASLLFNAYGPTNKVELYSPMGEFPLQQVNNTVTDVIGPAVMVGDDLNVTATRCSKIDKPLDVKGQYFWKLIDPPSFTVAAIPLSPGIIPPGCTTTVFLNKMPTEVISRSIVIFRDTGIFPVWQIQGEATAYRKNGEKGQTKFWQTQNFTVVVDE